MGALFELSGLALFLAAFEEPARALREDFEPLLEDVFSLRATDLEGGRDFEAPLEVRKIGDETAPLEVARTALAFVGAGGMSRELWLFMSCTAPLIDLFCMIEPF
jgi:hypothetical protein